MHMLCVAPSLKNIWFHFLGPRSLFVGTSGFGRVWPPLSLPPWSLTTYDAIEIIQILIS